jgi:hypothetical protein
MLYVQRAPVVKEVFEPLRAEQFAGFILGLDDTVGITQKTVSRPKWNLGALI